MNSSNTVFKKKCNSCGKWFPATTKYFYRHSSKGKSVGKDGRPYLKSQCKICIRLKSKRNKESRNETPEQLKRMKELKSARHAAYQRVALKYELDFKLFYKQELDKRGIKLKSYKGVQLKKGDIFYDDPKESK